MITVTIHQPNYLPWLGFFKKIMDSDIFVFLDDVQFPDKSWCNRNYVRNKKEPLRLTVPIIRDRFSKINEVKIDNSKNWSQKHKKSILTNYSKTKFIKDHSQFFKIYDNTFEYLIDLNLKVINYILEYLEIHTKTILSSELNIDKEGSERILEICKKLNADTYISGPVWAKDNLNIKDFEKNNIKVKIQTFKHPIYPQNHPNFIPNLATIDLILNNGKDSIKILENTVMEQII